MPTIQNHAPKSPSPPDMKDVHVFYFSELLKRRVCAGKIKDCIGKLSDIVFRPSEPYPEAVGLHIDHGWGTPVTLVPWDKVVKIEDDAIFVQPLPAGASWPTFVDQPGWILVNEHLIGSTILDMDGRRIEMVNDVQMLESKGRMVIVHVDVSFGGFLRKWGLGKLGLVKERLISWKYVQPLSVEDAAATDTVTLSITRKQIQELPSEDLADVLEGLSGEEQEAVFSALDSEKAADTLVNAEPRAQRQLIATLRSQRARNIFTEMSAPQLADLFSVLPHDSATELMALLPKDTAKRVQRILSEMEVTAHALMSADFVALPKETRVGDALRMLKESGHSPENISYLYIVSPDKTLLGVADVRELVLADDNLVLSDIMVSPVVTAEEDDLREDLAGLFDKYHFRMFPVADPQDHILGVVRDNDIMKGMTSRSKG